MRHTSTYRPPIHPGSTIESSRDRRHRNRQRLDGALMTLPLRLFLAAGWLRASSEKIIDPDWWSGDSLRAFLQEHSDTALPFFRPAMTGVLGPRAVLVSVAVVVAQLAIGLAIALGRPLRAALRAGIALNVIFVLAGQVNPSAFYLVMESVLLFAIAAGFLVTPEPSPWPRSRLVIGLRFAAALAMAPYIRTIEPAEVIEDPAMMLAFMAVIMAVTTLLRWVNDQGTLLRTDPRSADHPVLAMLRTWLHCGPPQFDPRQPDLRPFDPRQPDLRPFDSVDGADEAESTSSVGSSR